MADSNEPNEKQQQQQQQHEQHQPNALGDTGPVLAFNEIVPEVCVSDAIVSSGASTVNHNSASNAHHHNKVSFLEFVEVSTDSSISPDISATITCSPNHSAGAHYSFHYEPLRPPAAITISPPTSPLVSLDPLLSNHAQHPHLSHAHHHNVCPPVHYTPSTNNYALPLVDYSQPNMMPSLPPIPVNYSQTSTSFSLYNDTPPTGPPPPPNSMFPTSRPLISYWSSNDCNSQQLPPELNPVLDHLISKSSSSDSDTNDSGTRLISDSFNDIASASTTNGGQYFIQPEHLLCKQVPARVSSPSTRTIDTILEQTSDVDRSLDTSSKFDSALWIQMQSELSSELRDKYLANSATDCHKDKKQFYFRRIGWNNFGFVCPLQQTTVRYLVTTVLVVILLLIAVLVLFAVQNQLWIFTQTGPDSRYQFEQDQYWHHGTTFYEIFPASFKDTDGDGFGDLNGITEKVSHLRSLGVSAVRLNSIFSALYYPHQYEHVLNFFAIDPHLGTFKDFLNMVSIGSKIDFRLRITFFY